MIRKVLIANRGEIALRVAHACRELGLRSVAVYSSADEDSPVVRLADDAVRIGPGPAAASYLYVPNIIEAARSSGADAVHPGYGFLSEDPDFAEICADNGLVFVGPRPETMHRVGDKAAARKLMADAGLPVLPGTGAPVSSVEAARAVAAEVGYPVMIKAAAGGGGRGITPVRSPDELPEAFRSTRASAQAVFRDGRVYLERYVPSARHVEVQVLCDGHGGAVHLAERDCSAQRRHQKLVEEASSPAVDPLLRERICEAALRGARSVDYQGAGTLEFLLDSTGDFWFMEMNARIQVEHPVTEAVTGVDLVQEQLLVAGGEQLSVKQDDVTVRGHAIECRINAEDPFRDFTPTPGRLDVFVPPAGPWTRVDTAYRQGSEIPPFYDSMIAKLIVWARDRPGAVSRMQRALQQFEVDGPGISTTIPFHLELLAHPTFRDGQVTTDFVGRGMDVAQ